MSDEELARGDGVDSKSARKRAHKALQDLGATLMELPPVLLSRIPLERPLREAVEFGRGLSKGARKRHVRHLGNLLAGADLDAINEAMERARGASRTETARLHRLERWRERLLEQGEDAIAQLCVHYPEADRQRVRHILAAVRKEREHGAPPRRFRELLRYLRQLDEAMD